MPEWAQQKEFEAMVKGLKKPSGKKITAISDFALANHNQVLPLLLLSWGWADC